MKKVHYEEVTQPPNESDPEGWSEILCGLDGVESSEQLTSNPKFVTCKKCLKRLGT